MESAVENKIPVSAHHMYGEMPSSNSTKKTAAAAERSDSLQNAAKFSGVRKRKRGEYVAEKWDPIMKKRVCLGAYNTAEEAAEAYLAKKCQFACAHHLFDEMPSSNSAAVAVGKKPFIQEVSFRDKSTLLAAEWHNMGKLRKRTFKKKQVFKSFKTNMHGKEPVESCKSDRCNAIKRNPKSKSGLLGIRKQKNGRYSAEIRDPIKHKQVWLGTFDTLEEASQAYLSKKSEFAMLTQGNKENKQKNCDEPHPESSFGASLSSLGGKMDSPKATRIVGVRKNKWGKYTSEIINPISKKKIWLGTFSSYEEACQAYKSKKLEFREIVKAKKKCSKRINSNAREKQVGKEKLVVTSAGFQPKSAAQDHANQNMKFDVQRSKEAELKSNMPVGFSTGEKQAEKEKLVVTSEGFQPESAAEETFHANQYMTFHVQRSKEAELISNMPFDFSTGEKQVGKEKIIVNCEGFQPESAAQETFRANQYMKFDVQRSKEAELKRNMPLDFSTGEKQAGKEKFLVNCEGFQPESAAEETFHAEQCIKFDIWSSKEAELQSKVLVDFSTGEKQGGRENADLSMGQWVQLPDGREVKFSLELGLPIIDSYGSLLGEFSGMDNLRIYDESIY